MAANLLPELRPFLLSNVRLTGVRIGAGAYGSVEEVAIPGAICAAKRIHDIFQDHSEIPDEEILKASTQFVRECQLMSTLRHPHIVQFLGVCFFPDSRLPALVMERLQTSLHDLLDPETPPPDAPKPFFPLSLKCSILHNVASGLTYLHEQSPPIIHRDLSARNVLLNSAMVAKIADLGVARIVPRMRAAATMTKAPGANVYMPPEALEDKPEASVEERDKVLKCIDIFSFGVVAIFTLSQTFPCNLLATAYRKGGHLLARTELERREHYMRMIYSQLREKHPLLQMIERCLDFPEDRPSIGEVVGLLEQARAEDRDEQTDMNKLELVQALQTQPHMDQDVQFRVEELEQNVQAKDRELAQSQQELRQKEEQLHSCQRQSQQQIRLKEEQLRSSEREKQQLIRQKEEQLRSSEREKQTVRQQLTLKEAELTRAEEREQQQIQEMRQRETELVQAKDRELAVTQQQLREKEVCLAEGGNAAAEELFEVSNICENPELKPFILSNVQRTGTKIGSGAYGKVEEVVLEAAAKTISNHHTSASTQFMRECRLMSTLRHPHIVQFLGVCFFPDSRLPALVMERLLTSLHDLLDPETPPLPGAPRPLLFFTMDLKCSVLYDVASGLAYLHERPSPIIHRDLSARNVLLNSAMVAKVADMGMARIMAHTRAMTVAPGTIEYMPPEAMAGLHSDNKKSTYGASVDIFSFGIVTIFSIGGTSPSNLLEPTYYNDNGLLLARTELQRRRVYMRDVNAQLRACGQLRGDHPLIRLIQQCLHNGPHKRPSIGEVLRLLEEARAGVRDDNSEKNKQKLVEALQTQPRNMNLEGVVQGLDLRRELAQKEEELIKMKLVITRMEQQQIQPQQMGESQQACEREYQSREKLKESMCGTRRAPLSDERAQQIIEKALKTRSVEMRNIISVLTGLMGAGKTFFLSRVFNQVPPSLYTSTGVAEQSCRGFFHHMGTMSSWELFSHQKILKYLAHLFHQDLPPADMARLADEIASLDPAAGDAPLPLPAPPTPTPSSLTSTATSTATVAQKTSPKPATAAKESDTSHSMMKLMKAPKDSDSPSRLELIQMIDTGGQPEYMMNMPFFIHFCHLVFIVFNLLFHVDDFPPMHYHEEGKTCERKLKSQFSNRQIIQKLASTLQAKRFLRKKGQCFRMVAVATHRDCVAEGELAARVKEYHQALKDILLPANNEELLCYSNDEIPFVLNLMKPDSTDLAKLDLIRQKVSESDVGERVVTPAAFLIFEQELAEFAAGKNEKNIVSLEHCLQVGAKLKMDADSVRSALIFFHRQFTFLYFRHVLPHLVFTKPQVPLDSINSIVQFSYKVESGEVKGVTKKLTSSLRDGIITEEILSHEQLSKCFVPGLYEPRHAIDLLCHTFTLAPLSREPQQKTGSSLAVQTKPSTPVKREKREYLMMCLRQAIPNKDIPHFSPASSEIAPLVVQFTNNCVPLSCFGHTISCLLAIYQWRLSRADDGSPRCLASNVASLFNPQTPGEIVLVDVGHSLQIHIRASQDTDPEHFPDICFQVRETVFSAVEVVFEMLYLSGIETSPAFICPCPREPHAHSASVYQFKSQCILHCSVTEMDVGAAEKRHIMWLDTSVAETMKPSLPKLLQFKVPQKVRTQYSNFGTFLLNDEDGSIITQIEHKCLGRCEHIVRNILSDWLQGKGKPVAWKELIETLRDCDLNELADTIQEKTQ